MKSSLYVFDVENEHIDVVVTGTNRQIDDYAMSIDTDVHGAAYSKLIGLWESDDTEYIDLTDSAAESI